MQHVVPTMETRVVPPDTTAEHTTTIQLANTDTIVFDPKQAMIHL